MDDRVVGHVQDGDITTLNMIKEWNENITIFLYSSHIIGKFSRKYSIKNAIDALTFSRKTF